MAAENPKNQETDFNRANVKRLWGIFLTYVGRIPVETTPKPTDWDAFTQRMDVIEDEYDASSKNTPR